MTTTANQPKYRVCYTPNGNSKTDTKVYELQKYCTCENCKIRTSIRREPVNRGVVTTKDFSKINEAADFLEKWTCNDGKRLLEPSFYKL